MTTPDPAPSPADEVFRRWLSTRAHAEQRQAARLVSDAERERACDLLNAAFSDGRLTPSEHEERTSRALAARTQRDLEGVLAGLTDADTMEWSRRRDGGVLPRIAFWVVGLFTSPFVFVGAMFALFGSDLGDHVFGLVLLVVFLPGLVALYRWAHPRG